VPKDAAGGRGDKFKLASEAWNKLSDKDKEPFEKIAAKDKERKVKEEAHLKEHGWFELDDGSKSTDTKNQKLKKVKKSSKSVIKEDDDESEVKKSTKKERRSISLAKSATRAKSTDKKKGNISVVSVKSVKK